MRDFCGEGQNQLCWVSKHKLFLILILGFMKMDSEIGPKSGEIVTSKHSCCHIFCVPITNVIPCCITFYGHLSWTNLHFRHRHYNRTNILSSTYTVDIFHGSPLCSKSLLLGEPWKRSIVYIDGISQRKWWIFRNILYTIHIQGRVHRAG